MYLSLHWRFLTSLVVLLDADAFVDEMMMMTKKNDNYRNIRNVIEEMSCETIGYYTGNVIVGMKMG